MKRFLFLVLSICLVNQIAEAQDLWKLKRYEVAVGAGPTFFFGDVGGFSNGKNALGLKDITIFQTRTNADITFKYRILNNTNIRFSFSGGGLKATDKRGFNELRGFEASMSFFGPAILGEYYFIKNKLEGSYGFQRRELRNEGFLKSLDFYVLSGIGGMFYSVSGNDKLENNFKGFNSGGFAVVLPIGVGSKYIYSTNIDFGLELGGRYALSDGIDGYTSQYSKHNDVYFYLNFVFIYKFNTKANVLPKR